ncbi:MULTISPECIES: ATP-binding protein [unclassified Novosphingobium]|uniref:ATP-binding protein n=1 Tax=unclassified Novosphingobium TaxID=2644732 RepID=UPI00086F6CEF|nr:MULTISPECIES: ATP-binding protein [unclassified Novosphingobium]MBN9143425.1 DUF4118 domain-containing protein [Novosphingobium sp.]MDR6706673.1 two-component system sensor histidine kinase KdpD [Novosphingobium sp. 1748]ODU83792.1 MAG: hypothetical protein ABT10_05990 [Novosphingobium sp. SCN 63-17]OJX92627.1 MAG: hypothetical protein BGP00_21930 [Novosphingobium sp. 63-713]
MKSPLSLDLKAVTEPERPAIKGDPMRAHPLWPYLASLGLVAGFSLLGILLNPWLGEGYASLVFVVGVSMVGALYGLMPSLLCALLSSLLFDFFVSEPVFELAISRTTDLAPPVVFALCAVISGLLSGRLRDEATRANRSNQQLASLLSLSRQLQSASSDEAVHDILCESLLAGQGGSLGLYRMTEGRAAPVGHSAEGPEWIALAKAAMLWEPEWLEDEHLIGCRLLAGEHCVGAMVVDRATARARGIGFMLAQGRMAALALERIDLSLRLSEAHAHARTEELKSALLASVSHDLRSPLTAISASAASLLSFGAQFDSETSHELLDGIVKESARLNDLTTNLLQMTRLEAGEEGLSWSLLPVGESLRAIMGRVQMHRQTHPMTLHMPPQELLVRTDATLFDLAVTNVLQNAIRYSPAGSPITIACMPEGRWCHIAISDEGHGIPPAEQERVFDRFYRLARDARVPQGSGLGLAIVRGFVQASGGRIRLESPLRDGQGTRITIILPLMEQDQSRLADEDEDDICANMADDAVDPAPGAAGMKA